MKVRILFLFVIVWIFALPLQAQDVEIEVTFAQDITLLGLLPFQADTVFPNTLEIVYAVIYVDGLPEGDAFDIVWLFEGDELDSLTYTNDRVNDDDFRIYTYWANGLAVGEWTVEIIYNEEVITEANFEITDEAYIFPIRFGSNCTRDESILLNEGVSFEDITYLFAYVEYANFDDETVTVIWQDDDGAITTEGELEFVFDGEGKRCISYLDSVEFIRSGNYSVAFQNQDGDLYRTSHEVEISD
ncbi:MAG: hypothetical protein RLP44_27760 [Aggregatilineales bacterium]